MKRLPVYILILTAVSGHALDLDLTWNPETNQNVIGVVDDSGVFHHRYGSDQELELAGLAEGDASGERGEVLRWDPAGGYYVQGKRWSWVISGDPCPGDGPYELLLHWDPQTGGLNFFVLDGAGQLYAITKVSWNPKGEPVPGPPPYYLSSAQDPKVAGVFPIVLDGEGQVWFYNFYNYPQPDWELLPDMMHRAYTGAAPTDFLALTGQDVTALGKTDLYVVDETGLVSRSTETGWEEFARIPGGEAPYRLDGFVQSVEGGAKAFLPVLDSAGQLFLARDDLFVEYGEPIGGTPPLDLAVYWVVDCGTYRVFAVDSNGALFLLKTDGEWVTLCNSF